MEKQLKLSVKHNKQNIYEVSRALANRTRINILELINVQSLSVDEIASKLHLPVTTVSSNISILEDAGLVRARLQSGKHGTMKLCSVVYETISLDIFGKHNQEIDNDVVINIPIGNYFRFDVEPTCGLVGENGFLGKDDDPATFANKSRINAQLIWFHKGFLEYLVPFNETKEIKELMLTMEACSEAPNYRNEWPSDITIAFNDIELGTWKCPGDFGGRKGNLTPGWWGLDSTQFGLLKTWTLTNKGAFLDYQLISNVTLQRVLKHSKNHLLSIKIMIKDDAKNIGGINIFGEKFGDYPQGLALKITYKD